MAQEPEIDWATDFDIGDPAYEANPYEIWDELRIGCPMAKTQRRGGAILPTRYEDVAAIAYDTEHFSSRDTSVLPSPEGATRLVAPPITSDPPVPYRRPAALTSLLRSEEGAGARKKDPGRVYRVAR